MVCRGRSATNEPGRGSAREEPPGLAPARSYEMLEAGRTIESLAARFNGERGQQLLAALTVAAKQPPTLGDDGNTATWQLDDSGGLPKTFRLQRIDGRWYLVDR